MIIFNEELQEEYGKNDVILDLLNSLAQPDDLKFTSHRWLLESLPKRMVYYYMYGDLLLPTSKPKRILDVGGGYTALSRILLQYQDYHTLDIMAHDDHESFKALEASFGKRFSIRLDWYEFEAKDTYDLVISNDLFPNVDQRLTLFLDKFLPICSEIRISLTYYNIARWYKVKRTDADEVFHMMAWDGTQLKRALEKYIELIRDPKLEQLIQDLPSLFPNKRQICMLRFQGGRGPEWK